MDLLVKGLKALSIEPSATILNSFDVYLNEIMKWSKVHNLTSIRDREGIIQKHFLDSLLFLDFIPAGKQTVLDVGTGAGFPGIPLKIVNPGLSLYLVEPKIKKVAFLRYVVHKLDLKDVVILEERFENLAPGQDIPLCDAAVVRALFKVSDFFGKAAPFIKQEGLMIMSKGINYKNEIDESMHNNLQVKRTGIPDTDMIRYLITAQVVRHELSN